MANWNQLEGAYGIVENMDELLQRTSEGDSEALSRIMLNIEHQSSLYPLTTAVVPELIKILDNDNQADKAQILNNLHLLSDVMDEAVTGYLRSLRGLYAENLIQLQLALVSGSKVYINLLSHSDVNVRRHAALLVSMFASPNHASIAFEQQYEIEPDLPTKACLLWFWGNQPPNEEVHYNYKSIEAKKGRLFKIVEIETSFQIRIAAALGWVQQQLSLAFSHNLSWPTEIEDILFPIILDYYNSDSEGDQNNLFTEDNLSYSLTVIDEGFSSQRICDYVLSFGLQTTEKLLSSPHLTPMLAHHIFRRHLDNVFTRVGDASFSRDIKTNDIQDFMYLRWGQYTNLFISSPPDEMKYQGYSSRPRPSAYKTLEQVVENDTFWELPTNLFSFFYGLPDDREKLRALLPTLKA